MAFVVNSESSRTTGELVDCLIAGEEVSAFVPHPLPPTRPPLAIDRELLSLISSASHALGRLDGLARLSNQPDLDLLIYGYVRMEAVLSSQIEGTQSSLDQLLLFEAEQVPGVPIDDVTETANYLSAINYAVSEVRDSGVPISVRLICGAHARLLAGSRGGEKHPGEFRKSPVWIGGTHPSGARFIPPPFQAVPDLIAELERFINDVPEASDPLLKAALAHVQFETIHPFHDGNGRVGRLLITLILSSAGLLERPLLYLSLYFKQNRDEYYELLNRVRSHGDWESWIKFFLRGVISVSDDAVLTAGRISELLTSDRARLVDHGRASRITMKVFDQLAKQPVIIPQRLAGELGVTPKSVNNAIGRLEELGIASEVTGKRRNRVFVYTAYVAILSEYTTEPFNQ